MNKRLLALPALCLAAAALAQSDPMRPLTPPAGAATAASAPKAAGTTPGADGKTEAATPWLLAIRQDGLGQRSALINMSATAPGAATAPRWLREGERVSTADGEARIVAIRPLAVELQRGQERLTQQLLAPLQPTTEARPAYPAYPLHASDRGTPRSRLPASTTVRIP